MRTMRFKEESNIAKVIKTCLSDQYSNSSNYKQLLTDIEANCEWLCKRDRDVATGLNEASRELKYPTSFLKQLTILSVRTLRKVLRDPRAMVGQFVITVFMSLIIGGVYFDLDRGPGGLQNRVGVMFFLLVNMVFGNLNAMTVFLEERQIFRHESANGYYRVSGEDFAFL